MTRAIATLLLAAALLAGCAAETRLVTNDKVSAAVKAKGFGSYKEVLLIPPREDPRTLVPRVVREIEAMGFRVRVMDPTKPIEAAQGTGFVIGSDGWILTCAHVMGAQQIATVTLNGRRLLADVVKVDRRADLALLRVRGGLPEGSGVLGFRTAAKPATMGEDVFTIGYPLSRLLGNSARMSRGLLSATTGLRDNQNEVQVSAEIHPGNSGGPLLDRDGNVIGVVNKTINPSRVAQATGGALPQNINFAIKLRPVLAFVEGADASVFAALDFDKGGGLDRAGKAIAKIQAGIVGTDAERRDKMVVRLAYVGTGDLWHRLRAFVLVAFDFDTHEPLFIAGQGREGQASDEETVVNDTLAQFRKAIGAR